MKNGMPRKATALFLSVIMLTACVSVQATETAQSGDDVTINISVKEETVAPNDATAAEVEATGAGDASMTVNGDVSAVVEASPADDSADACGAVMTAENGNTASLEVTGKLSGYVASPASNAYGADIQGKEGSTISLRAGTIEGVAHGENSTSFGVMVSETDDCTVSVKADGISSKNEDTGFTEAVSLFELGDKTTVTVDAGKDGITAQADGDDGYATAVAGGISGNVTVNSEGDITAKTTNTMYEDNQAYAVSAVIFDNGEFTVNAEGDVTAWAAGSGIAKGANLHAEHENGKASLTIAGKLAGETEAGNSVAYGAEITAGENSTVSVEAGTIEGVAHGANSAAEALEIYTDMTGKVTVNADGISAISEGDYSYADAVVLYELAPDGTVEVNAGEGGITAKSAGDGGHAKAVSGMVFGDVTITSEGDITAASTSTTGGSNLTAGISTVNGEGSSLTVRTGGGITASVAADEDWCAGIDITTGVAGTTRIEVAGDVTASGGESAAGILVGSHEEGAETEIEVGGVVTAEDAEGAYAISLYGSQGTIKVKTGGDVSAISGGDAAIGAGAWSDNNGEVTVEAGGNVTASASATEDFHGFAIGVDAGAEGTNARTTVTVAGGISAQTTGNTDMANGIQAENGTSGEAGLVDIRVAGTVESSGTGIAAAGAERSYMFKVTTVDESEYDHSEYKQVEGVGIYEEKIYYHADGDYYYDENGHMWQTVDDAGDGMTRIEVKNDVTGGNIGLDVSGVTTEDIIVDGTLSGGNHAVILRSEDVAEHLTLTVWEIKPNADGSVAEIGRLNKDGELETTECEELEKTIQYIIRLEQPEAGGSIYTEGTFEYEGYNVAHEGDTVILKVNLQPGYEIVDAFNGTDTKVSLLQDENGEYYLVVPRGGGVLLSVKLRKIQAAVSRKKCSVTMDPNGGTLRGSTEAFTVTVKQGDWLSLPEAPEKEGAAFLGWYGTEYPAGDERWTAPEEGSKELLKEKSRVYVKQDLFYTAIWKAE